MQNLTSLTQTSAGNITIKTGKTLSLTKGVLTIATSSSTSGSGFALTSTYTKAFGVYADDNGTLLGEGAVRAGQFRTLVTLSHSNETSIFGCQNQLKIKAPLDCTLTTGNRAGSWNYLEMAGTLTKTLTLSGTNKVTAGCFGMVEWDGVGALTISADHVLAGFAALTNVVTGAGTFTQTGHFAGFATVNNSTSSYAPFNYGLYITPGSTTIPIQIGQSSSSSAVGHHLTSTAKRGIAVFTDDNSAAYGADADGIYSRTVVLAAQTGAYAVNAIRGHLLVTASLTPSGSKGFYGTLSYLESSGTHTFGDGSNFTIAAAAGATVETGGTPTIAANAVVCGLHISGKTLPASPTGEAVGILFQAITQGFEHTFGFSGVGTTDGNGLTTGSDSTNVTHKIAVWINGVGTRYLHVFSD